MLYSSYLSNEYDVISIASSGQSISEMKNSYFIQFQDKNTPSEILGDDNELVSFESILSSYSNSTQKYNNDYNQLLSFSKTLNSSFQKYKIPAAKESLLFSGILLATRNNDFMNTYKKINDLTKLSSDLYNAIIQVYSSEKGIDTQKLENIKNEYLWIKNDTSLTQKNNVLRNFIVEIDENVNSFIKTYKYIDVLGQFYIEFLRFANQDKGLGIVLTPPHITELMSELVDLNKDSIVFDNCTGTSGFLVSAMKKMISLAKGNIEKEKEIKQKQLLGIEYNSTNYALAVSNMFLHEDGKSNIFQGDCFDIDINQKLEELNIGESPNAGLLNPPFKSSKDDIQEMQFIENNLDSLSVNSLCAAIIPISNATELKGPKYEIKKRILKKHTLEAVFSMPLELFYNSNTSVVSVIMVFRAKYHIK